MENIKYFTRDNNITEELQEKVEKEFKGIKITYLESYYLDFEVNEETGMINYQNKVKHYTKNQLKRNMKNFKSAYLIAKGAVAPQEIIEFRKKHGISASTKYCIGI